MKTSVVIPAYNSEQTILTAINSTRRQSRPPEEIIVVDDGSTDRTSGLVGREQLLWEKSYELSQPALRIIHMGRNCGVSAARNAGIKAATGELLVFLDSDDELHPDAIRLAEGIMEKEESDWCACSVKRVLEDQVEIKTAGRPPVNMKTTILRADPFRVPFFRKAALLQVGMYDASLRSREDWELTIRMAQSGKRLSVLKEPLYVYQGRGLSGNRPQMLAATGRVLRKHLRARAISGDLESRRAYADECWRLARSWLRDGKSKLRCLRWAAESLRFSFDVEKLIHPVLFQARRFSPAPWRSSRLRGMDLRR